jgi:uncharacterized protein (TIGR02217 family)
MQGFDDVLLPLAFSRRAQIRPSFSTRIVGLASGQEYRSSAWADARLSYDIGPALVDDAAIGALIAFFRARHGAARAFRLMDPSDHSSHAMTGAPSATDMVLGMGDGVTADFPLIKAYGNGEARQIRRITHPIGGSVSVAIDGVPFSAWSLIETGLIRFTAAPPLGATIAAGFQFHVPVRFASDVLEVAGVTHNAAEINGVELVEVKGDA